MVAPVFLGTVTEAGRLVLTDAVKGLLARHLSTLKGKPVVVSVTAHRKKRSVDQNAWLWGVALPALAEALGYDEHEHEMLHYSVLAEYFGTVYDPRTGREWPAKTSSQMNTKQFGEYMEWFVRWAATEHHCVIQLPNENEQ